MRASLMYGAGDVRVENVPDPVVREPGDALVRVLRSCICGSDLWPYWSKPPSEHGSPMGHEFLGVVEDTGANVAGLQAGDLVVAPFVWSDGTCGFCREGLQTSCRHGGQWGGVAPARAYIEELMPDILGGTIQPGRVFKAIDQAIGLEDVPGGYRAMAERRALKVLIRP